MGRKIGKEDHKRLFSDASTSGRTIMQKEASTFILLDNK